MRFTTWAILLVLASVGRCQGPEPAATPPPHEPRAGESVHIRGRLDEDVDCRLLRAEGGRVYSLSERLPNLRNGARVCVHGTIAMVSQCLHAPSIEVEQVKPYSSCP